MSIMPQFKNKIKLKKRNKKMDMQTKREKRNMKFKPG